MLSYLERITDVVNWFRKLGAAGEIRLRLNDIVTSPGGGYEWSHIDVQTPRGTFEGLGVELVLANPDVAVVDLIRAGVIHADISNPPHYFAPTDGPIAPQVPQPVDNLIGIPDISNPGTFLPTDTAKASMPLLATIYTKENPRIVAGGDKYYVTTIILNPGQMFQAVLLRWAKV